MLKVLSLNLNSDVRLSISSMLYATGRDGLSFPLDWDANWRPPMQGETSLMQIKDPFHSYMATRRLTLQKWSVHHLTGYSETTNVTETNKPY